MKARTIIAAVVAGVGLVMMLAAVTGAPVDAGPEPGTGVTVGGRSAVELDHAPADGEVIGYGVKTDDGCAVDLRLTATPELKVGRNEGTMGARIGDDCQIVYVADPEPSTYLPGGVTTRATETEDRVNGK